MNGEELGAVLRASLNEAPMGRSEDFLLRLTEGNGRASSPAGRLSPQKRSSESRKRRTTISFGQRVMRHMTSVKDQLTGAVPPPNASSETQSEISSTSSDASASAKILDFFWMHNEFFLLVTTRSVQFYHFDCATRKLYHLDQLYATSGNIIYAKFANEILLVYEGKKYATVIQFDRDPVYERIAMKYVDIWRDRKRESQQEDSVHEMSARRNSSPSTGSGRYVLPSPLTSSSFATKFIPRKPTKIQFDVSSKHEYVYPEELSIHEIYDRICIIHICTKKQELSVYYQNQSGSSDIKFTKAMSFNLFGAAGRYLVSVMDSLIFVHNIQDKLTMCFDISWKERKPVCMPMQIDARMTSGLREMKETQGVLMEPVVRNEGTEMNADDGTVHNNHNQSSELDFKTPTKSSSTTENGQSQSTPSPQSPDMLIDTQQIVVNGTTQTPSTAHRHTLSPLTKNNSLTSFSSPSTTTNTADDPSPSKSDFSESSGTTQTLHSSLISTPQELSDSPPGHSNGNLTPGRHKLVQPSPLFSDNDTHSNLSTGSSSDVGNDPTHVRLYSRHWKAFEPNFIFDVSSGYLFQLQFSLRDMPISIRPISEHMNFLLRRADGKKLFLHKLKEYIQQGESMKEINSTFFLMNKRLKRYLQFKMSKRDQSVEEQGSYPYPVITQRDVYIYVLHPLQETIQEENPSRGINITIEYIRSLSQLYIPIEPFMQTFLIRQLIEHNDYSLMHEFVQYKVISDSKEIATLVYSLAKEYPPAFQIAMDMLSRLKEYELMCECLLECGEVIHALRMMNDHEIMIKPRIVFDAVLKKNDSMLFFNACEIQRGLNRKVRGSPKFLPSENVEDVEAKFVELFHTRTE